MRSPALAAWENGPTGGESSGEVIAVLLMTDSCGLGLTQARRCINQWLLEPVMRVGFGIEGLDFDISRAPIEVDRLTQAPVGLEAKDPDTCLAGVTLQFSQQPPADAEATHRRLDPHPLQLSPALLLEPQRAAA